MRHPALTRIRVTEPAPATGPGLGGAPRALTRRRPEADDWFIPLPASLIVHAAIILLLLYAVHRQRLTPPSPETSIAVVFQNTGLPHSAAHNAAPKAPVKAPPTMETLPPPPPPPPSPAQPQTQPQVNLTSPSDIPFNLPKEIIPAPPPKHAVPRPIHHAPPAPRQKFMVMNGMSFGQHPTTIISRAPGALNLAPPQSDLARQAPSITFQGNAGPDWESAFNKWVNEHKYYPEAAAAQNEQGNVTISFTVLRNGQVTDLHLLSSSGAPLLDMAWYGLFRGVHVPPFPPGSTARQEKVIATMHFVLIH